MAKADAKAKIIGRPIRKVSSDLKKNAWSAAAESLIFMIFGILLVAWPDMTVSVIANVLGAIFIVNGIYQIINYFVVKGQNDFFNNNLLIGTISLLLGIVAIVIGEDIANVFRIIIGIWMIYESLVRVNTAIKLHSAGIKAWSYICILALIMFVLGVFITFNTGAVVQLIGCIMIFSGIVGIISDAVFIMKVNEVVNKITK